MSRAADRSDGSGAEHTLIPQSPEAVVRKGSGEQAAAYIRQLVFDGQLQEGMRLPQDEVAKAVGVSRIPIREAIIALEREGWVTTRLHRGTFVNAFDEQVIRDHYELFGLVYGLGRPTRGAARGVRAHRAPDRTQSQLVNTTDDLRRIGELAYTFHTTVVEAAHSPRITVVLRAMSALVPGPFFVLVPNAVESERKGLKAIVRAIAKNDGDRAAKEYGKMLNAQAELVVELFHQRQAVSQAV